MQRGTDSGTPGDETQQTEARVNYDLAAALELIRDLPLTKDEKVEAVRRLLRCAK